MESITLTKPKGLLTWLRLRSLYLAAFPPEERKPFAIIAKMHRLGKNDVWCICRGSKILGLATTVKGEREILLDYLAVDKAYRGQGIGTAAIHALKERYPGKGLFLEIESVFTPGDDLTARKKRKDFYLACGFRPLGVLAEVFGVNMELLGYNCQMNFAGYKAFYAAYNSPWAAEHVFGLPYPESKL